MICSTALEAYQNKKCRMLQTHSAFLSVFTPVLAAGGHAAPDVALLFIEVKDLSNLDKEGRIALRQTLGQILVDGGFGDTKLLRCRAHGGSGFDHVHSQFTGSLLKVMFHRLPSDAVLLGKLMRRRRGI